MGKIYRHVERKRNISRKGSFTRSVYYGKIKSDSFALPGDPSVTLRMTDVRVIMNTVKSLGRSLLSGTLCAPPLPLQRESILPAM